MTQITSKLEEVRSGKAKEYLGPLAQLQENMRIRMEVTANLRQFRLINVTHKYDAEDLAIRQNYEVKLHTTNNILSVCLALSILVIT